MSSVTLDLEQDLVALLHQLNQPARDVAREMIVLEMYRRGMISSGKAGELLSMPRWDFVRHASRLGLPYWDMTEDEWQAEQVRSQSL